MVKAKKFIEKLLHLKGEPDHDEDAIHSEAEVLTRVPKKVPGLVQRIQENDPSLTSVRLRCRAKEAKDLAGALRHNHTVTALDLYHNFLGIEGVQVLADSLRHNTTVSGLNLGDNNIGPLGMMALARALQSNRTISFLGLTWDKIGAGGARSLAAVLRANRTITDLVLQVNNIGPEGAAALAGALPHNSVLARLDLYGNHIKTEGAKALAVALEENRSIVNLDLRYNDIDSEGAKSLARAYSRSNIAHLDLRGNDIGEEGAEAFANAIMNNPQKICLGVEDVAIAKERLDMPHYVGDELQVICNLTGIFLSGVRGHGLRQLVGAVYKAGIKKLISVPKELCVLPMGLERMEIVGLAAIFGIVREHPEYLHPICIRSW